MLNKFFKVSLIHKPIMAVLAAVFASFAMSLSPVMVRLSEIGPFTTAFYRFFLSFPILIMWMIIDNRQDNQAQIPKLPRDYLLLFGAGALLILDLSLWYLSLHNTTIINATLLNNMSVVIVPLITWLFFREKLSIYLIIGVALALTGSFILVGHSFSFNTHNLVGDGQAFISAFFYSLYMLLVKKLRDRFSTPTILAWSALPCIYILGTFGCLCDEQFFPQTAIGWLWLTILAVVVHVLGQGALTFAMAHLSASITVIIMSLAPVFSAIFGWLMLNETLSPLQISGAVVVLLGIIIAREIKLPLRWKTRNQNTDAS